VPASPRLGTARRRLSVHALALTFGLGAVECAAQEPTKDPPRQYIGLAGTDLGTSSSYSYVGVLTPLSGQFTGNDWVLRGWLEYLTYDTDDAFGELEAHVVGGNLGIARSFPLFGGSASAGVGVVLGDRIYSRETSLDDGGFLARFRMEGNFFGETFEGHHLRLFGSITVPEIEEFARADYLFEVFDVQAGPTVTLQNGQDYRSLRYGLRVDEIALASWLKAGVTAGWEDSQTEDGFYAGVSVTLLLGFQ
jgi:hypothetical protein